MYENVIVPNDGSLEGRIVFAPASDLAWRCGARVVNVSNTEVSDKSSKAVVKQHAISQSASDMEFWVDLKRPLAEASLKAAAFRTECIFCVASPPPAPKLIGRRRPAVSSLTAELAKKSEIPVVVIGPVTDTARGLPMTELVVALDGTPGSDAVLAPAAAWAQSFKLRLVLTTVDAEGASRDRSQTQQYLDALADSLSAPGGVGVELAQGAGGIPELAELLESHENAVVMIATGPVGTGLDRRAEELIKRSPRAVVLVRT